MFVQEKRKIRSNELSPDYFKRDMRTLTSSLQIVQLLFYETWSYVYSLEKFWKKSCWSFLLPQAEMTDVLTEGNPLYNKI